MSIRFERKTALDFREEGQPTATERTQTAQHWPKALSVSDQPHSLELISRAHQDALFVQSMFSWGWGMMSLFAMGLVGVAALVLYAFFTGVTWLAELIRDGDVWFFPFLALTLAMLLMGVVSISWAYRIFRIDIRGPKDVPIVFTRRTRKVYMFREDVPELGIGWRTLLSYFKPWPLILVEYDWNCLEAEYQEITTLVGKNPKTVHILTLYVKESPTSDTVIGSFPLASPLLIGRHSAKELWEHIRRFMEEGGPHLSPGDKPATMPSTLLQCIQNMAPNVWPLILAAIAWAWYYGLWVADDWLIPSDSFWFTMLHGFPFYFGPLWLITVFFNWLGHKFGQRIELPPDLMEQAGPQLDLKELARQAKEASAKPLEVVSPDRSKNQDASAA